MAHRDNPQLTQEVVGPSTRREVALTAIGTLTLVALVNGMMTLAPSTNVGYWALEQQWRRLLQLEQGAHLLVLGDSTCRQGIVPGLAAGTLGLGRGLNLCATGDALLVNDAWMLETYLRRFPPPEAVLVVHTFDVWERDPSPVTVAQVPLAWGFWNRLEPSLEFGLRDQWRIFASRHLPLYANDQTLRQFVTQPLKSVRRYRKLQGWLGSDGFVAEATANPEAARETAASQARLLARAAFRVSGANRRALDRMAALAETQGFPLFLAHGPVYRGLAADPAFQRRFDAVGAHLRSLAAAHPNVRYVPEQVTFPAAVMQDHEHVTVKAARHYTQVVASRVATDPAWSRRGR